MNPVIIWDMFGSGKKYLVCGGGQSLIFRLKSQALGSEQLKCRQWESDTFTVGDYSLSISQATRAMAIAMGRRDIKLFCSCKLILVINVFLAHFMGNKFIKSHS